MHHNTKVEPSAHRMTHLKHCCKQIKGMDRNPTQCQRGDNDHVEKWETQTCKTETVRPSPRTATAEKMEPTAN